MIEEAERLLRRASALGRWAAINWKRPCSRLTFIAAALVTKTGHDVVKLTTP